MKVADKVAPDHPLAIEYGADSDEEVEEFIPRNTGVKTIALSGVVDSSTAQ